MSKVYGGLVSSPYNKLDTIGHFSVTHTFDGKTIDGGVEEPATIILTTFPESIGAVSGDGIFLKGSSVTVVATPDLESEYPVFVGWYNGDTKVSSNSSYTFTVNSTSTLVAKFEEVKYDITLQKDPASTGTVTGGGRFVAGASVTVVATPDSESEYPEFDGWYEGETKVSENASYTFIVSGARTLVAKFKEATPTIEYVDLGLPSGTKWGDMNVGAEKATDAGKYFQWGDTQGYTADQVGSGTGQKAFRWSGYKFTEDSGITFTKYNGTDGKTVLEAADDAAVAALATPWLMPTTEQIQELFNNEYTTNQWVVNYQGSGVNGYLVTSKSNGNSVFFPAAGYASETSVSNVGSNGSYWSSSLFSNGVNQAWCLGFLPSGVDSGRYGRRCLGCSVRPVQNGSQA